MPVPTTNPVTFQRLDFSLCAPRLPGVPSQNLPQRQSLVTQTAAFLEAKIDQGEYREWLPSERSLCELLQVSRNTLRSALEQLSKEGLVRAVHGTGNQILRTGAKGRARRPRSQDVALLAPEPIERLRPYKSLWIDEMRALLSERGVRLRVFHGAHYFGANPGAGLQKLVARNPHGCWILLLASEGMQRWFAQNEIPCLLAGSPYPGLDLPFRDLDHRAMCRHAAGVLLGLGHRRLAMLTRKSSRAGDLESEAGFVEGVRQSRHADAESMVIHHAETVASAAQAVQRIINLQPAPTALLVIDPHYYLAAASRLALAGVRLPGQISMISRDDDPFLAFMAPVPARYVARPHAMAKSLLQPVLELLAGKPVTRRAGLIMPEFIRGESIAAPA
jgi:DNA-binding LacI/PurR family transcriptional regulator